MTSLWLDRVEVMAGDPFPADEQVDVVVVGAGLTGLTTATQLARAGQRVMVVEARTVGAVTTGNTTGKLSLLQGTHLSMILSAHSRHVAAAYVDGNRAGMEWLLEFCADQQVGVQRRDAVTYATGRWALGKVRDEFSAAKSLGLGPQWHTTFDELPYPTAGGVMLPGQAQFDPMEVLAALSAEARRHGARIVEHTRVTGVTTGRVTIIHTQRGNLRANHVVLASGVPFLDRGLYFAKTTPQRSYAAAYAVPGSIPAAMYLASGSPSRSLRTAPHLGSELLLVGGNGHVVGRQPRPTTALVADLDEWTGEQFPGAARTHVWSAQDYSSANHVPFIGRLPGGAGKIWLATGYSKWGMTNAGMAALMLTGGILGGLPRWAKVLQRRVTKPPGFLNGARNNAAVGLQGAAGWVRAELSAPLPAQPAPPEGSGVVRRRGRAPVGVSTVDGVTCAVSAVCTHLGGVLRYNDQERSWDCPLHGSRFAADGSVLEGPATEALPSVDLPNVDLPSIDPAGS